jgi:hypothetical protein
MKKSGVSHKKVVFDTEISKQFITILEVSLFMPRINQVCSSCRNAAHFEKEEPIG